MNWVAIIVGLVALQRLGELVVATRNTRTLLNRGGVEHGARHYPLIVLLHAAVDVLPNLADFVRMWAH